MSEEESKQKVQKAKVSKLAVISLVLMMPAAIVSIDTIGNFGFLRDYASTLFGVLYLAITFAGFIIAAFSFEQIIESKGRLKGKLYGGLSIAIFIFSFLPLFGARTRGPHPRVIECVNNLHSMKVVLDLYCNVYDGKYPSADKWCDLIKDDVPKDSDFMICPAKRRTGERCSYAINPYCEPNAPPDTVLLFETKGGWNQFGGIEVVSADNHPRKRDRFWGYKIRGCNILFNDGSIRFVREEDFTKLKWKPDEAQQK
jgi:hypothetical protein